MIFWPHQFQNGSKQRFFLSIGTYKPIALQARGFSRNLNVSGKLKVFLDWLKFIRRSVFNL
jgi:hypothetical protein